MIEISDDSVAKIGRWPWDRDWHATLIGILKEQGARAVVFDVLFSEPSDPEKDTALAQSIQEAKNVYLAEIVDEGAKQKSVLTSLPAFMQGAKGSGHINLEPDVDGVMRRVQLAIEADERWVPQLSLAVALDEMGADTKDLEIKDRALKIRQRDGKTLSVPLDTKGRFLINWAGRWKGTFEHYSYIDVVTSYITAKNGGKPSLNLESFKDKICFVGTSAAGLFDIRPTPLEPAYPAVGANLNVLQNLLDRRFIHSFDDTQNFFVLALLGILLLWVMKIESHFKSGLIIAGLMAGVVATAIGLFKFFNVWVNVVYPLALIFLTYFFVTLYNQLSVAMERAKLFKMATRDSLTGLINIGHFKQLLKAELMTIALRREKKLSIIMSDVDNFKKTNDTYGHVTGDEVLKEVAKAFQGNCRALDVPARYGRRIHFDAAWR